MPLKRLKASSALSHFFGKPIYVGTKEVRVGDNGEVDASDSDVFDQLAVQEHWVATGEEAPKPLRRSKTGAKVI